MGKAFKLGDNISTDAIIPGRFFYLRSDLSELAKHLCEDIYCDLYHKINKGDFIVAGKNFGLGSSREHAAQIIKLANVDIVLAKSFARIFYRNAVNIGLLPIECNTDDIDDGDELEFNLKQNLLIDKTKKIAINVTPIPPIMHTFIKNGGIVNYINKYGDLKIPPELE